MAQAKKNRMANFELLRCIAMMKVVGILLERVDFYRIFGELPFLLWDMLPPHWNAPLLYVSICICSLVGIFWWKADFP